MDKKTIKLSILDQSVVRKGGTAAEAVANTIQAAKLADELGYHRFWVSEHHNSAMIAGSAPEVLMVKLADETRHIRIGSGGIMMPNHSTLKVAENFRMLETLFPGRIDLGMGRAPGGDRITASLLNPANSFSEESYLTQLEHLQAYFKDEAGTQYGPILAVPQSAGIPEQWVLCSSGGSAAIAAKYGLGLVIAKFINGYASREIVDNYRFRFKKGVYDTPREILAVFVICAETEEKAAQMRKAVDYVLLQFERGKFEPLSHYSEIADYIFSPEEEAQIRNNRGRLISGTARQVKDQLTALAEEFDVDELIISTMAFEEADRLQGFRLLAEAFQLNSNQVGAA